ncbi:MAG TPA: aldo/keto reductase [Mycobacteriales bacterium]|nr:aldo/keto reductase [Mycobacteriales bacterium]
MAEIERRILGTTGLSVSALCLGGSGIGSMPAAFGYDVPERQAIDTVLEVLRSPINFLDTAAGYSDGESERRIGLALAEFGGVPDGVVVATKVDPIDGDYSGAAVIRSAEGSRQRLGLDQLPLLYLHDPEPLTFVEAAAPGGPLEALVQLREQGVAAHIGVAGGPVPLMADFVRSGLVEVLITHNRWTLVDRSAGDLLDLAAEHDVAVVNGAPFGGGVLAKGSRAVPRYAYRDAEPAVLQAIQAIEAACERYDVPLATAALQFSLREPRIASTIAGISRPERVAPTVAAATAPVPQELWDELEQLAAPADTWLY